MPWLPTNWGFRPPGPCVSLCACFASPMDSKGQLQWNSTSVESLMKQKFQWINYVLKHEVSHDLCRVSYILLVTKDVVCFFNCLTKDDKLRSSHIIPHVSYPKSLTVNLDHEDTRPGDVSRKAQSQISNTTTRYRIKSHHLGWWPFATSIAVPNCKCCWTDCGRIL